MLSRLDMLNRAAASSTEFQTQTSNERGTNNLFVGGTANDYVVNDTDQAVILTGAGNDFVDSKGTGNRIESNSGNNTIKANGNNTEINVSNGNNTISSTGNNGTITTDNGNNNISVNGNNNSISTNNGDNTIAYKGDSGKINTNDGNNTIVYTGNKGTITTDNGNNKIAYTGNNGTVNTDNGNNNIVMIGSYSTVNAGNGNDNILSIGNYANLNAGQGNNSVVFQGDNVNITAQDGNNFISSLDFATDLGLYTDYAKYLSNQRTTETEKNKLINSEDYKKVISSSSTYTYDETKGILDQLSAAEKKLLKGIDLNEKVNGKAKYILAKGADGTYHIYQYQNDSRYKTMVQVQMGSNYLYLNNNTKLGTAQANTTTTTTTTTQDMTRNTYADIVNTILKGNKNVNINVGNGNNQMLINHEGITVKAGDGNNDINAVNGILEKSEQVNKRTEEVVRNTNTQTNQTVTNNTTTTTTANSGTYTTGSPLIIDFNQDGEVSAKHGIGVDVDGNGTADGAATNGDKMLAFSDVNGNGTIDGSEVFGDKTVNPFTGEALNAANGFEALKMVAEAAEAHTGIKCLNDGLVDLKALNEALQSKGLELGFISDDNNTELEKLSKVSHINVSEYTSTQETGKIQHNQIGSAIFEDGSRAATHDVWFELTGLNNPFES